jgi:hypothetical protein
VGRDELLEPRPVDARGDGDWGRALLGHVFDRVLDVLKEPPGHHLVDRLTPRIATSSHHVYVLEEQTVKGRVRWVAGFTVATLATTGIAIGAFGAFASRGFFATASAIAGTVAAFVDDPGHGVVLADGGGRRLTLPPHH